ncbi:MAG: hypothetical protein EP344_18715 [Bacteroidetes bacterium]|nr:MAG: hypothetical protein EP344_18715 [Bacteroidota bacterium]
MEFFSRLQNGWQLAMVSFATINRNKSLLLFPVFSSIALVLVLATFFGGSYFLVGEDITALLADDQMGQIAGYILIFIYYLVNFSVIVFFNAALIHCAIKILNGEETHMSEGLSFAMSRIDKILGWAVLAATVGTLLQFLQNTGKIGKIVASLLGMAWSILTFFVVPVLVYQNLSVFDSVKESGRLMREKWGESLAGNVSFGLFYFLGLIAAVILAILLFKVHPVLGILVGVATILLVGTVITAARTVFVAAVYNRTIGQPTGDFDDDLLDSAFVQK